jgi:hypothetical protein
MRRSGGEVGCDYRWADHALLLFLPLPCDTLFSVLGTHLQSRRFAIPRIRLRRTVPHTHSVLFQNRNRERRLTTAFGANLKSSTPLEPKFSSNSSVPAQLKGFEGAGMGRFVELHEGVEAGEAVRRIKGLLGLERGESRILGGFDFDSGGGLAA